jgi:hypothetical protein
MEQLSETEKDALIAAYNSGKKPFKKQYRKFAKAYHPDLNPEFSDGITFEELSRLENALSDFLAGNELSSDQFDNINDILGRKADLLSGFNSVQVESSTLSNFAIKYPKNDGPLAWGTFPSYESKYAKNPSNPLIEDTSMANFAKAYLNTLRSSNDPEKRPKLQNWRMIAEWFLNSYRKSFNDASDLEYYSERVSNLGYPDDKVRNNFYDTYANLYNLIFSLSGESAFSPPTNLTDWLKKYIDLTYLVEGYFVAPNRTNIARSAAQDMIKVISLIKFVQNRNTAANAYDPDAYLLYQIDFENTNSSDPNVLSVNFLSNLSTGLDLRGYAAELFEDGKL